MTSLTRRHVKLLDAATTIRLDPDKAEAAYLARQLVQATLPHKDPGKLPLWSRTNGNLTLTIQPGHEAGELLGYPYGSIPRLLLFWITTEALHTKNRRLVLGDSLAAFMRQLDLDPHSRGKRSDAKRLREQMKRLFRARISFDQREGNRKAWLDMQVAPEGMLWWDEKQPDQPTLWHSWIELNEKFFEAITVAPVPVDMRALKALKRSPLALDLYAWATYTAWQTQQSGQPRSVSWESLHKQFGSDYHEIRNFQTKAWEALKKIQAVYPELGIKRERGGLCVLPCTPAITIKKKR